MRVSLQPQLVDHAREFAEGRRTPAEPRDAATVILSRAGDRGPEVYLLRRQTSMAFAGGMCVFPGGGVDPRDFDASVAWAGPDPSTWATQLATSEEFRLLFALAQERGRVVSRDELLQKIWGRREGYRDRTVDVFVRKLREKIDRRSSRHTFIQTRYGVGYKLEAEPKASA